MNRIALILPYFGIYPNYFPLWMKTAKRNSFIDFFIITDQVSSSYKDNNLFYIPMTLSNLKDKIQSHFDFDISLERAYKVCDYRPAFGIIFSDVLEGYDFWGHCDSDVIWGDLRSYITEDVLNDNQKIYSHGHLTLYRNNDYINSLFYKTTDVKMLSYVDVFKSSYPCHFDESEGMTYLSQVLKVQTYDENDFADLDYRKFCFSRSSDKHGPNKIYKWDNGTIYELYKNCRTNLVEVKECSYIHLQKRIMANPQFDVDDCDEFFIIPNSFIPASENTKDISSLLIENTTKNGIYWDYYRGRYKTIKSKFVNGYLKHKYIRLSRKVGIKG